MPQTPSAPLNIVKNSQADNICNLKCSYKFAYLPTNLEILNKGDHLVWKMDEANIPPVVYNDENYSVKEARIYSPSVHTYGPEKNHADAELIIIHTNRLSTESMMVCIPITTSSTTTAECATLFDFIFAEVKRTAATKGKQTNYKNYRFSLEKFVPRVPYYSYIGTLPWSPKNGSYSYVVFDIADAITMSTQSFMALTGKSKNGVAPVTGVIYEHSILTIPDVQNPDGLYFNPNGPVPANDGEIYIDCQPTGSDGEVLVPAKMDSGGMLDNELLKKMWNYSMMKIIVGALVMVAIWRLAVKIIDGIASNSARMAGGMKGAAAAGGMKAAAAAAAAASGGMSTSM
jgi:hypothetical protein